MFLPIKGRNWTYFTVIQLWFSGTLWLLTHFRWWHSENFSQQFVHCVFSILHTDCSKCFLFLPTNLQEFCLFWKFLHWGWGFEFSFLYFSKLWRFLQLDCLAATSSLKIASWSPFFTPSDYKSRLFSRRINSLKTEKTIVLNPFFSFDSLSYQVILSEFSLKRHLCCPKWCFWHKLIQRFALTFWIHWYILSKSLDFMKDCLYYSTKV